jgi:YD repeat-containing protein
VPGPSDVGGVVTYMICLTTVSWNTAFWGSPGSSFGSADWSPTSDATGLQTVIQSIVLPNGTYWGFVYDTAGVSPVTYACTRTTNCSGIDPANNPAAFGDLTKLILPTGGWIDYQYNTVSDFTSDFRRVVHSRSIHDNNGGVATWTYNVASYSAAPGSGISVPGSTSCITSVIDPLQNETLHYFKSGNSVCHPPETDAISYQNNGASRTQLKKIHTDYLTIQDVQGQSFQDTVVPGINFPLKITETSYGGYVKATNYNYSTLFNDAQPCYQLSGSATGPTATSGAVFADSCNNYLPPVAVPYASPISVTVSDGSGTLSQESYAYKWQDTPTFKAANLLNSKEKDTIFLPGTTTPKLQTTYSYDENSISGSACTICGYMTSVTQLLSSGESLSTHMSYYPSGKLASQSDAKGNASFLLYDSNGISVSELIRPSTLGVPHKNYFVHDMNTGSLLGSTDQNGTQANDSNHATLYRYDLLNRLVDVTSPPTQAGTGETSYCYVDFGQSSHCVGSASNTIYQSILATPDPTICSSQTFDGLGRRIVQLLQTGGCSSTATETDSAYDGLGRVHSISNPYIGGSPTSVITYLYDALGRVISKTAQDGVASSLYCYENARLFGQNNCSGNRSSFSYATWVDVADSVGNDSQQVSDGLNTLRAVIEPNPNASAGKLETDYSSSTGYSKSISQIGDTTLNEVTRMRTFVFDSLDRMTSSHNPETGTISYSYRLNGNLCAGDVTVPCTKTDSRGVSTTYSYDALNRLTQRSASDGITRSQHYSYDGKDDGGNALPWPYPLYAIGRLSRTSDDISSASNLEYDSMGQLIMKSDCLAMDCSYNDTQTATYDLAGNMTSLQYPYGPTIFNTYDTAGRLSKVTSNGTDYISGGSGNGIAYTAAGAESSLVLGNGVSQSNFYNNRLQPCHTMVTSPWLPSNSGGGNLIDRESLYSTASSTPCGNETGNNGNIAAIADFRNTNWSQTFSYDALNRLHSAIRSDGAYYQTYNYDSFGNMILQDHLVTQSAVVYGTDPVTNRMLRSHDGGNNYGDYVYDAAGNLTQAGDGITPAITYQYNATNQLLSINGGQTASYLYDAMDDRVHKQAGNIETDYVYFGGQPIAELDQNNHWTDYIYANGRKIAKVSPTTNVIHISGTNTGRAAAWFLQSLGNISVASGDHLIWQQMNGPNSCGGINMQFSNSTQLGYDAFDNYGYAIEDSNQNGWHTRSFDLSSAAGSQINNWLVDENENCSTGNWNVYFADVAIVHADGSIVQLYDQSSSAPLSSDVGNDYNYSSISNLVIEAVGPPSDGVGVAAVTHYYIDDHLGRLRWS